MTKLSNSMKFKAFADSQFNSLPNDKILDQSKLKGFADDRITVIQNQNFVFGRVENIVGKGENACKPNPSQILDPSKLKNLQTTILSFMKMAESSPNR